MQLPSLKSAKYFEKDDARPDGGGFLKLVFEKNTFMVRMDEPPKIIKKGSYNGI